MTHARDDMDARMLREQQVEADRVLEALTSALAADGDLLDNAERSELEQAMQVLREARDGRVSAAIEQAIKRVDAASDSFASRRMDASIRRALAGHRVDEL
jgi:molecular chaperone HscA